MALLDSLWYFTKFLSLWYSGWWPIAEMLTAVCLWGKAVVKWDEMCLMLLMRKMLQVILVTLCLFAFSCRWLSVKNKTVLFCFVCSVIKHSCKDTVQRVLSNVVSGDDAVGRIRSLHLGALSAVILLLQLCNFKRIFSVFLCLWQPNLKELTHLSSKLRIFYNTPNYNAPSAWSPSC